MVVRILKIFGVYVCRTYIKDLQIMHLNLAVVFGKISNPLIVCLLKAQTFLVWETESGYSA